MLKKLFKFFLAKKKLAPPKKVKILVIDYIFYKELLKSFDKNIIDMFGYKIKRIKFIRPFLSNICC